MQSTMNDNVTTTIVRNGGRGSPGSATANRGRRKKALCWPAKSIKGNKEHTNEG